MSSTEIQSRIRLIREELETRTKTGIVKMATEEGAPISSESLQNEMFSLIYRLSKFE